MLARALYKDAPIVVLDEPTAALDPVAEHRIYQQFNNFVEGKTAIYISHRLSSCRFCDTIAVFRKGELVQCGTHDALLQEADGEYKQLWDAQNSVFDTVRLISVPSCRIVWVQTSLTIRGFLDMETSIRELERSQAEAVVFLGKVGVGISEDNQLKMVYPKTDG